LFCGKKDDGSFLMGKYLCLDCNEVHVCGENISKFSNSISSVEDKIDLETIVIDDLEFPNE
jgi:hypothetical protein